MFAREIDGYLCLPLSHHSEVWIPPMFGTGQKKEARRKTLMDKVRSLRDSPRINHLEITAKALTLHDV